MMIRSIRIFPVISVIVTLMTLFLTGCSSDQSGETDAQKAKREAVIRKHKDAMDNGK